MTSGSYLETETNSSSATAQTTCGSKATLISKAYIRPPFAHHTTSNSIKTKHTAASHRLRQASARGVKNMAGLLSRPMACRAQPVVAAWTKNTLQDHFFKEAKKQGYVSRAAFKLLEIQKKHQLIKQGAKVLDLGCVPGAWLQVACQQLGPHDRGGLVLGVDIQEVVVPPRFCDDRVQVLQADARLLTPAILEQYTKDGFDVVLSDMLQFTNGVNDVELSLELANTAMNVAVGHYYDEYGEAYAQQVGFRHSGYLRPGGSLVMKVYEGAGTQEFTKLMQRYFKKVARMRVEASRSMSREFYAIGIGRKPPAGGGSS